MSQALHYGGFFCKTKIVGLVTYSAYLLLTLFLLISIREYSLLANKKSTPPPFFIGSPFRGIVPASGHDAFRQATCKSIKAPRIFLPKTLLPRLVPSLPVVAFPFAHLRVSSHSLNDYYYDACCSLHLRSLRVHRLCIRRAGARCRRGACPARKTHYTHRKSTCFTRRSILEAMTDLRKSY